jgi:hypothetical protein
MGSRDHANEVEAMGGPTEEGDGSHNGGHDEDETSAATHYFSLGWGQV